MKTSRKARFSIPTPKEKRSRVGSVDEAAGLVDLLGLEPGVEDETQGLVFVAVGVCESQDFVPNFHFAGEDLVARTGMGSNTGSRSNASGGSDVRGGCGRHDVVFQELACEV